MSNRILTSLAGLALLSAPAAAQQVERQTIPGDRIAIYDLAGQVRIEGSTGKDVVVEIARGGKDQAELKVLRGQVETMPGFETLRVIFQADVISYPKLGRGGRTEQSVRDDGTFGNDGNSNRGRGWRSGRRVMIGGSNDGPEAWADLKITIPVGRLVDVNLGVGDIAITNVDGHLTVDASSGPVTARGTKGSLSIDTGSGTVSVTDAQGDVSVNTGSGEVELTTFRGTTLSIDAGSGSVSATAVTAESINVETGSGDIVLSGISSPDVTLDTGSGAVDLDLASDVDQLAVDTGSGAVTLHVPDNVGASIDIEAGSGGVESDIPLEVTRWGSDRVTGRIGDGKGRIVVETGSGRVKIVKRGK
ncbi:MAG: hypothetical protein EXR93_08450 [Gemmatimonadetes bacterium]|nr:hypothetical protein [Gemmatimonadota bacterium]